MVILHLKQGQFRDKKHVLYEHSPGTPENIHGPVHNQIGVTCVNNVTIHQSVL